MFIKKNKLIKNILDKSKNKRVLHNPDDYKFGSFQYEAQPLRGENGGGFVQMIITGLHRLKNIRLEVCRVTIPVSVADNFHPVWINMPTYIKPKTGNITGYIEEE